VSNEVEGVTDRAFDERDEMFSHDGLLGWTRKETAGKHHACPPEESREKSPQIIYRKK
jgi:hypothetical protein